MVGDSANRDVNSCVLDRGENLCEAALWTAWEHRGNLEANEDTTTLAIQSQRFHNVTQQFQSCAAMARLYATSFVENLNQMTGKLSDFVSFGGIAFDDLRQKAAGIEENEHFLFLSHYKVEAGTEATLLKEALEGLIKKEIAHPGQLMNDPVFLDSSNLVDLAMLRDKVNACHNLVVLLTPGILKRPWCLVEIVTAVQCNINILPVEIARPGLQKFTYPDEKLYAALARGEGFTSSDIEIFTNEGIELSEIAHCVRQVFLKIAIPFSPHKSANIRNAEMLDILARCEVRDFSTTNFRGSLASVKSLSIESQPSLSSDVYTPKRKGIAFAAEITEIGSRNSNTSISSSDEEDFPVLPGMTPIKTCKS